MEVITDIFFYIVIYIWVKQIQNVKLKAGLLFVDWMETDLNASLQLIIRKAQVYED